MGPQAAPRRSQEFLVNPGGPRGPRNPKISWSDSWSNSWSNLGFNSSIMKIPKIKHMIFFKDLRPENLKIEFSLEKYAFLRQYFWVFIVIIFCGKFPGPPGDPD